MRRFATGRYDNITLPDCEITFDITALVIGQQLYHQTNLINEGILTIPERVGKIAVIVYNGGKSNFTSPVSRLPWEKRYEHDRARH